MVELLTAAVAIFVVFVILSAWGTRKLVAARQGNGGDSNPRRRKRSKGARDRDNTR